MIVAEEESDRLRQGGAPRLPNKGEEIGRAYTSLIVQSMLEWQCNDRRIGINH